MSHQVAKYWSFSISPSSEHSGLISFRIDWFDLLEVQSTEIVTIPLQDCPIPVLLVAPHLLNIIEKSKYFKTSMSIT